jgi:hypothetical protein
MPFVNVRLIEGVFTQSEKQEMIRKLTETMVAVEGKKTRDKVRRILAPAVLVAVMLVMVFTTSIKAQSGQSWSIKADYIEACSCHLFCSCYFNTSPEDGMRCVFNNAVKIQEGHVGNTKVDGLKFWVSGDLGGDFTKGMKGAVITVEPGISKEQEEAIKLLISKVYPVKWGKVEVDHASITWEKNGMKGHALLGKGQGEVVLEGVTDSNGEQSVLRNVKYWGAHSNTGFYLAKSTHHYKGHGYNYELKDRNGFFIHIESSGTT